MTIVATPPNVDADPKMDSSSIDDDDDDHSDSNSDSSSSSSSSIDSIASSDSDSDSDCRSNERDVLDCWPAAAAIATAHVVTTDAHHDHPQDDDDEEKELNSVLQKIFKCVARNPWIFLVTSILITVALSAVGVIIGEFAVEVESRGWWSRGTLMADREMQLTILKQGGARAILDYETLKRKQQQEENSSEEEDVYDVWNDLLTNNQAGYDTLLVDSYRADREQDDQKVGLDAKGQMYGDGDRRHRYLSLLDSSSNESSSSMLLLRDAFLDHQHQQQAELLRRRTTTHNEEESHQRNKTKPQQQQQRQQRELEPAAEVSSVEYEALKTLGVEYHNATYFESVSPTFNTPSILSSPFYVMCVGPNPFSYMVRNDWEQHRRECVGAMMQTKYVAKIVTSTIWHWEALFAMQAAPEKVIPQLFLSFDALLATFAE